MSTDLDEQIPRLLDNKIHREDESGIETPLDLLCEYWHLALKKTRSEDQENRLEAILDLAESDTLLSTLLTEANYFVSRELGLFNPENMSQYEEFQDEVRDSLKSNVEIANWNQHLQEMNSIDSHANKDNLASLLQEKLKLKGYYGGPVDGYFGPISKRALKIFQRKEIGYQSKLPNHEPISVEFGADTLTALFS